MYHNICRVGNPPDQKIRCTEFVTIFSSASGRFFFFFFFFFKYLDLYQMDFYFQIKRRVRGKSSSFWRCKPCSAIGFDSREHSENVFRQNSCTLSRWPRLTEKNILRNVLEN